MKKIISLIIAVLVLVSCFSLPAFADGVDFEENIYIGQGSGDEITFTDNFTELYAGNSRYTRFNSTEVYTDEESCNIVNSIKLNASQQETVKKIELWGPESGSIVWASINYADGALLELSFIHSDYAEIYNQGMKDGWQTATIDFSWNGEKNIVTASRDVLCGQKEYLMADSNSFEETFFVEVHPDNCDFYFRKGELISYEGEYYYLDYKELGIDSSSGFYSEKPINFEAYKITDKEFIKKIDTAIDKYYSTDLGFMEDDSFTQSVADFFTLLLFAVIPFAVLVIFLILAIRARTPIYRRLFYVISALSLAELITFGVILLYIFANK